MTSTCKLPPELEFVRHAVQAEPDWSKVEELASRDLDWEEVLEAAFSRHRVGSLMYRSLRAGSATDLMPERVLEAFEERTRATTLRNLHHIESLCLILKRFGREEIPVVPFKGPVLSKAVYRDITLRHYNDIDILVPPGKMLAAEGVLKELGYDPVREINPRDRRGFLKSQQHTNFEKENCVVELHRRLTKAPADFFEVDELIDRCEIIEIEGTDALSLRTEDRLLLLCVHGSKHRWFRLKWLCDVAHLVEGSDVEWQSALAEADQRGCTRRLLSGLSLASTTFDVELPRAVDSRIRSDPSVQALVDRTYPRYLLKKPEEVGILEGMRYHMASRDTLREALKFCWWQYVKPTRADHEVVNLPDRLSGLYYAIRAGRAIGYFTRGLYSR